MTFQSFNTINKGKKLTDYYKTTIPEELENQNLECNPDETEQYTITINGDQLWKSCKYLGTLLDTQSDITLREHLTMNAMTKLKHLWEGNEVTVSTKTRIVDAYIRSVFMYNAQIWTLNKTSEKQINVFNRKLLRKLLKIRWPTTI